MAQDFQARRESLRPGGSLTDGLLQAAGWLALSDHSPAAPFRDGPVVRGSLVLELALPLTGSPVLLDIRNPGAEGRVLSLFLDHDGGVAVLQRQGERLIRHHLPGPLAQGAGLGRLVYGWDRPADRWTLTLTLPGAETMQAQGSGTLAPWLSDLLALCQPGQRRHPAVQWFGVTRGTAMPESPPWIGASTPVLTDRGLKPAGSLRPGDRVETVDGGLVPVLALWQGIGPGRGSLAPVLLRAAYFQTGCDLLVAPDQPILFDGPAAEYLFGEEEVLILARHLVDGKAALWDDRRAVAGGVAVDLGTPELIICDGVALPSHTAPGLRLPRRLLDGYEAVPLMALRDSRIGTRPFRIGPAG